MVNAFASTELQRILEDMLVRRTRPLPSLQQSLNLALEECLTSRLFVYRRMGSLPEGKAPRTFLQMSFHAHWTLDDFLCPKILTGTFFPALEGSAEVVS